MRRGNIGGGGIFSVIIGIIFIGFLIAVFRQFDWDVIAAFQWIFTQLWDLINKIANKFTENPWFRNTFR